MERAGILGPSALYRRDCGAVAAGCLGAGAGQWRPGSSCVRGAGAPATGTDEHGAERQAGDC